MRNLGSFNALSHQIFNVFHSSGTIVTDISKAKHRELFCPGLTPDWQAKKYPEWSVLVYLNVAYLFSFISGMFLIILKKSWKKHQHQWSIKVLCELFRSLDVKYLPLICCWYVADELHLPFKRWDSSIHLITVSIGTCM